MAAVYVAFIDYEKRLSESRKSRGALGHKGVPKGNRCSHRSASLIDKVMVDAIAGRVPNCHYGASERFQFRL